MNGARSWTHLHELPGRGRRNAQAAATPLDHLPSSPVTDVASLMNGPAQFQISEQLGAPVWYETLRRTIAFPASHPNAKTQLRRRQGVGNVLIMALLPLGVFTKRWFAEGSTFPRAVQGNPH